MTRPPGKAGCWPCWPSKLCSVWTSRPRTSTVRTSWPQVGRRDCKPATEHTQPGGRQRYHQVHGGLERSWCDLPSRLPVVFPPLYSIITFTPGKSSPSCHTYLNLFRSHSLTVHHITPHHITSHHITVHQTTLLHTSHTALHQDSRFIIIYFLVV